MDNFIKIVTKDLVTALLECINLLLLTRLLKLVYNKYYVHTHTHARTHTPTHTLCQEHNNKDNHYNNVQPKLLTDKACRSCACYNNNVIS